MIFRTFSKSDALITLRPGAEWVLRGDDLEWLDSVQTEPSGAEIAAEIVRLDAAEPMIAVRVERDRLLAGCDWWCVSDRTPSQVQLDYRTALRDFPSVVDTSNIVWPEKPE
jgi:hypothetical protein